MRTSNLTTPCASGNGGAHAPLQNHWHWISFNRKLDEEAGTLPNEASLEKRLDELMEIKIADRRIFWLTLARIAELALKLAGDYADTGEFQAAGDLLVNPRRIDVYLRGQSDPVIKHRHGALSDQFAQAIGTEKPVVWLGRETFPHIRTAALLPFLERMLAASGLISPDYLAGLRQRMCKIADTVAFLMAWQIGDSTRLYRRMQAMAPDERANIKARLCNFDRCHFHAMGDDIESLIMRIRPSRYFVDGEPVSA